MNVIKNENQKIEETIKKLQNYRDTMNAALKNDNPPEVERILNMLYSHTTTQIFEYVKHITSHCKIN